MAEERGSHYDELIWVQPEWLHDATGWVREQLTARGLKIVGECEQPHLRWWSTLLTVPTDGGRVWFKASAPPFRFEAGLALKLAAWRPDCTVQLLAADPERGWMLMPDAGPRLREVLEPRGDLSHWERILPLYAGLQIDLAPHRDELLSLGVRDLRIARIPELYERLLDDGDMLLLGLPNGLTSDELRRLEELAPEVRALASELAGHGFPETLQHDDLHDGQVFVDGDRYRIFDWGDSCVSHPFHTLVVTLRSIVWTHDVPPGAPELLRLRDAYLEPWTRFAPRTELVAACGLAHRLGTIGRTLAWQSFASAMPPAFAAEPVETVPYGLKLFLEQGPIGTWSLR